MDVLKSKGYVESPQMVIDQVWQELKLFKLKRSSKLFYSFLEYRYAVLSRGMQLSELTKSKCSLVDLSEI
jgi:lipoprotein NlpI